jgi:exodeoxyribonuclease VII large subunit
VGALIYQLGNVRKVISHFDAVAIVRGGGGDIGLSCYNKYELALAIALFPIPVITGIGHATNETVAEMVAYENAITPTKLADYFVQKFHNFSVPVRQAEETIIDRSRRLMKDEKSKFAAEVKLLRSAARGIIIEHKNSVREQQQSLVHQSRFRLRHDNQYLAAAAEEMRKLTLQYCASQAQQLVRLAGQLKKDVSSTLKARTIRLTSVAQNLNNLKPENVLKRGYSITMLKGKSVRDAKQVKPGEELTTLLLDGRIVSTVKSAGKSRQDE